jgi:hypothetical protein
VFELDWILALRIAGAFHLVTLLLACFTPIPADWETNLARLPEIHRRFAVAQNLAIGGVIAFCGCVSLFFAPVLVSGDPAGRLLSGGISLWWAGRLLILPWLRVRTQLTTVWLKTGYALLMLQCAIYAVAYGWLAAVGGAR